MPNPTGQNQLSPHGYGDVQAQKALLKESPISGAPQVAQALNAPQRGSQAVVRGSKSKGGGPAEAAPPQVPPPTPGVQAQVAQIWAAIAAHPDASPLVQSYAQRSQVA